MFALIRPRIDPEHAKNAGRAINFVLMPDRSNQLTSPRATAFSPSICDPAQPAPGPSRTVADFKIIVTLE